MSELQTDEQQCGRGGAQEGQVLLLMTNMLFCSLSDLAEMDTCVGQGPTTVDKG